MACGRIAVSAAMLFAACSARQPAAPDGIEPDTRPRLAGSTTVAGRGWPHGSTASAATIELAGDAPAPDYGYDPEKPIKVGAEPSGPANSRNYLSSLAGPNGETLFFQRKGSCCAFELPEAPLGGGLLDVYAVTYDGTKAPLTLYINMYERAELYVPHGLTAKK